MKADVAIVGAGIMGAATAWWLTRMQPGLRVVLVERDTRFAHASSSLSASSIRQQFSLAVNVRLSQFGLEFLRTFDIALHEAGYLYLGDAASLAPAVALQNREGADVALLDAAELARRFPWLNVADVECGALGLAGEGWFDGPALHQAVLRAARHQGARVIEGVFENFTIEKNLVTTLHLRSGEHIECEHAVNAAGPWARAVAAKAGIDLPVHARRRTVFVLSSSARLPGCPLVIDPTNFWFRPEGARFIAGTAPARDADDLPLEPDYAEFDESLWARMAHRVPGFEALRVEQAWAGYYDMNLLDHNALLGAHPAVPNLWFICGFSGHGMQHAGGAARGLAERILLGRHASLDLAPLDIARLAERRPLPELNIIG